jgi:hypothetical protein
MSNIIMTEDVSSLEKFWLIRLYEGLDLYWSKQSAWSPVLFIIFAVFSFAIRPGAVNSFFGRDADLTKRVVAVGQFQPHSSRNSPYVLAVSGGGNLHLACYPRGSQNDCLLGVPIDDGPVSVVYAPLQPGWPHLIDGVILQIQSGPRILVSEADRLRHLAPRPMTAQMLFVNVVIFSLVPLGFGTVAIFVGIGLLNTLKRIMAKFKYEQ